MPSFRFAFRYVIGFVLAPLAAGVATFVVYSVLWTAGVPLIGEERPFQFAAGLGIVSIYVAVPVTVGEALPLFVWMNNRAPLSLRRTLGAGAFLGVSWYFLLLIAIPLIALINGTMAADARKMWSWMEGPRFLTFLGFIAGVGMLTAAFFWLIAVWRSPLDPRKQTP